MNKIFNYLVTSIIMILLMILISCDAKNENIPPAGEIELSIVLPGTKTKTINTRVKKGQTLLDVMQSLQEEQKLEFGAQKSNIGTLINSLSGIDNKKSCPCWIYTINGRLANKGVDSIRPGAGDKIQWCYLKYEEKEQCQKI